MYDDDVFVRLSDPKMEIVDAVTQEEIEAG